MNVKYLTIKKNGYTICGCPEFGYCIVLNGHVIRKPFRWCWKFRSIEAARACVDQLCEED